MRQTKCGAPPARARCSSKMLDGSTAVPATCPIREHRRPPLRRRQPLRPRRAERGFDRMGLLSPIPELRREPGTRSPGCPTCWTGRRRIGAPRNERRAPRTERHTSVRGPPRDDGPIGSERVRGRAVRRASTERRVRGLDLPAQDPGSTRIGRASSKPPRSPGSGAVWCGGTASGSSRCAARSAGRGSRRAASHAPGGGRQPCPQGADRAGPDRSGSRRDSERVSPRMAIGAPKVAPRVPAGMRAKLEALGYVE